MTHVACQAWHASHMTTSTGRLPPCGHVRDISVHVKRLKLFRKYNCCQMLTFICSGSFLCLYQCKQQHILVYEDNQWDTQLSVLWICYWLPWVLWPEHRPLPGNLKKKGSKFAYDQLSLTHTHTKKPLKDSTLNLPFFITSISTLNFAVGQI